MSGVISVGQAATFVGRVVGSVRALSILLRLVPRQLTEEADW